MRVFYPMKRKNCGRTHVVQRADFTVSYSIVGVGVDAGRYTYWTSAHVAFAVSVRFRLIMQLQ